MPFAGDRAPLLRPRILLIEDDLDFRQVLVLMMPEFDCSFATTLPEIARLMETDPFDWIVASADLRELCAATLYAAVIAVDAAWAQRFIFMTAGAETSSNRDFLREVSATLRVYTKPFSVRALAQELLRGR